MAARSRAGTMIGGWLTIRYRPSASSPSLDSACRLSRVWAFWAVFSPRSMAFFAALACFFACLPFAASPATVPRTAVISSSSGSWAYQISTVRMPANPAMASR